jgi:serine/threonine protein kinase
MSNVQKCPSSERLQALLIDEGLPREEQESLSAHLERCAECRDSFDRFAAESRMWSDVRGLAKPSDDDTQAYVPLAGVNSDGVCGTALEEPIDLGRPEHPSGLPFLELSENPDRIGTFGVYEAIEVIGRGGFGVVLKAFDPALHRVVALKVLAPQLAAASAARRRFVREARAAASVAHEHVVTIHSVDEWQGWPYLVMQYVGGKSLQDRIDKTGPLELKEILRIGMQTAAGLSAAHAQGLVHRDIKPANILLENGVERVKLTDFGLARAVDDPSLTQAGTVAGTPQYMSPEQAKGDAIDPRADLFSLGCVMYAMATGQPPFRGSTTMSVLRKVCDEAPGSIRASNSDIPLWLEKLILKLLSKDPEQRYQTANEVSELLADQLSRVQQGLPVVASDFEVDLDADLEVEQRVSLALASHLDVGPAKKGLPRRVKRWQVAAALSVFGLLAIGVTDSLGVTQVADTLATVLRIKTPEGTLVVEVEDPEVQVSIDGGNVVVSGGGAKEVKLSAGPHKLQSIRNGEPGPVEMVTVSRGGKKTWSARFEPSEQPLKPSSVMMVGELPDPVLLGNLRARYEDCGREQLTAEAQLADLESSYQLAVATSAPTEELCAKKQEALAAVRAMHVAGTVSVGEVLKSQVEVRAAEAAAAIAKQNCVVLAERVAAARARVHYAQARQGLIGNLLRSPLGQGNIDPSAFQTLAGEVRTAAETRDRYEHQALAHEVAMAETVAAWKRDALDSTAELQKRSKAMLDVGALSNGEFLEAEARLIRAKGELAEAEVALNQAKQRQQAAEANHLGSQENFEVELRALVAPFLESRVMTTVRNGRVIVKGENDNNVGADVLRERLKANAAAMEALDRARLSDLERAKVMRDRTEERKQLEHAIRQLEWLDSANHGQMPPEIPEIPQMPAPPDFGGVPAGLPDFPAVPNQPSEDDVLPVPPQAPKGDDGAGHYLGATSWVERRTGGVSWYWNEKTAFALARKQNQPVLLEFWADTPKCRPMIDVRDSDEVNDQLTKFVCVRLYLDRLPLPADQLSAAENERATAANRARARELSIEADPPAYLILHTDGRVLTKLEAKADTVVFNQYLTEGVRAFLAASAERSRTTPAAESQEVKAQADQAMLGVGRPVGLFSNWLGRFWSATIPGEIPHRWQTGGQSPDKARTVHPSLAQMICRFRNTCCSWRFSCLPSSARA